MIFKKLFLSLLLVFTIFNFAFFAYSVSAVDSLTPLQQCANYCKDTVNNQMPAGMACLCSRSNPKCPAGDPNCAHPLEQGIIDRAINWIFYLALVLCPLFILFGAAKFFMSGGDPKNATTGRKIIMWAVIGLAVAFATKIIYAVIRFLVGQ